MGYRQKCLGRDIVGQCRLNNTYDLLVDDSDEDDDAHQAGSGSRINRCVQTGVRVIHAIFPHTI